MGLADPFVELMVVGRSCGRGRRFDPIEESASDDARGLFPTGSKSVILRPRMSSSFTDAAPMAAVNVGRRPKTLPAGRGSVMTKTACLRLATAEMSFPRKLMKLPWPVADRPAI